MNPGDFSSTCMDLPPESPFVGRAARFEPQIKAYELLLALITAAQSRAALTPNTASRALSAAARVKMRSRADATLISSVRFGGFYHRSWLQVSAPLSRVAQMRAKLLVTSSDGKITT
ncbi:jg14625 [Pararge aegeria aegeria]|uniref:Jg14625 protein n=1 Tax=Pararge aegeria aegeria TaxID=348720 RepID=A0A8S4RXP3_9NEOP|nr:jg14625 [Pararge aegeria aegeria]